MTTYTAIANTDIDQDSPVTQPLMTAMRDNPIAIAEGASGAPKLRTKNVFGGGGALEIPATNYDFTGLDDFGGARFYMRISYTGTLTPVWQVSAEAASGSGFNTPVTFFGGLSPGAVASQNIQGYWNKVTGTFKWNTNATGVSVLNFGSSIETLRITTHNVELTGGGSIFCYIYLMPDGGESTT